jgi:hypothetical protein
MDFITAEQMDTAATVLNRIQMHSVVLMVNRSY